MSIPALDEFILRDSTIDWREGKRLEEVGGLKKKRDGTSYAAIRKVTVHTRKGNYAHRCDVT